MPETLQVIPERLKRDRYWAGLLLIFKHHHKLRRYFTSEYVDLVSRTVASQKLKKLSAPWSQSEKFMLNLALHLFNPRHKVNLEDMDYLDEYNFDLAIKAINLRFRREW